MSLPASASSACIERYHDGARIYPDEMGCQCPCHDEEPKNIHDSSTHCKILDDGALKEKLLMWILEHSKHENLDGEWVPVRHNWPSLMSRHWVV
jgi:hypothetical protein